MQAAIQARPASKSTSVRLNAGTIVGSGIVREPGGAFPPLYLEREKSGRAGQRSGDRIEPVGYVRALETVPQRVGLEAAGKRGVADRGQKMT